MKKEAKKNKQIKVIETYKKDKKNKKCKFQIIYINIWNSNIMNI
jgi:hypothetical protein